MMEIDLESHLTSVCRSTKYKLWQEELNSVVYRLLDALRELLRGSQEA